MYSLFEKLISPFPSEEPKQPPNSLFAFCRHYTKGSERYIVLMGLFTGIIAVMEVSLFGFLGHLVDWLNSHSPESLMQESGNTLIGLGLVIVIVIPLSVLIHSMLMHQTLLGNFPMRIRWSAHRYLIGQSIDFYQNEFAGRLATKVMQTSLAVRETIMKLLDVILYVAVYFTGAIILVATLDIRLAIPFFFWATFYGCLLVYFLPRLAAVSARQADARSDMTGRIVDTYTNITTVKLFSHSGRESHYAQESMDKFLNTVHPQMRLATSLTVCVSVLNALLTFSIAALSIYLWTGSLLSSGAIATAIGLVLRMYGMSQWVMWEISALFENIGTARDGMNTLSRPRTVQDSANAAPLKVHRKEGIVFNRVCFHYGKQDAVINDFSLTIKPGEKIGLVGRSGAGKSTLVNLLLRLYDIESGEISIDGQDISKVAQHSLRSQIGMVTQDTSMLHRTVRENLVYGRPTANEEDIIAAAKQAQAHDFIMGLEDGKGNRGYDAHVGERGIKLSGGQRQRLAIARVLLKNAPILILDEATSALDSEVESAIQENLIQLMVDKTVIAIAHRLSTIAALDRLIVLDEGKIVEHGTHQELIEMQGIYAQLWAHQSGGFLGEQ